MTPQAVLEAALANSQLVVDMYLSDLTEAETLHRPGTGLNHIRWQMGHLINAEHGMINQIVPGSMPALPEGFAARYTKETSGSDNPGDFDSFAELKQLAQQQRAGTLAAIQGIVAEQLTGETGVPYAARVVDMFVLQGTHWLMHAGQWAVIRRQLGRPPMF